MCSSRFKKIVAVALSVFALNNLVGCSSQKSKTSLPEHIDNTTEWYDCATTTIDSSDVNFDHSRLIFANNRCKVIHCYFDPSSYDDYSVLTYINDSDEYTSIDMHDCIHDCESVDLKSCFYKDDDCYAVVSSVKQGETHNSIYKINADIGSLELVYEFDSELMGTRYYVNKVIYKSGNYYVQISYLEGSIYKDAFCILDSQYEMIDCYYYNGSNLRWTLDDSDQIIAIKYEGNYYGNSQLTAVRVNVINHEENAIDISSDVLFKYNMGYITEDGYVYSSNSDLTLTKLCLYTGEEELVLDFNNSAISIFDLDCSEVIYCDENNILLNKTTYYPNEAYEWEFYSLTKANVNPHAGKQILYVAPYFRVNSLAANAIQQINETSETTYVYVTMRYSTLTFIDYESDENSLISKYNKYIALLNVLKQDIRNGRGPDVLLDFGQFSTLNSNDYLHDLLPIINDINEFNREEYFDNIFDALIKNDRLYQLPVSACVGGIYADDSAVDDLKKGFTFEGYQDYVASELNGFDPLEESLGRDRCFEILVRSSYNELYDDNNRLTLNNDTFISICDYVTSLNANNAANFNTRVDFVEFYRIGFDLTRMMIREDGNLWGLPSIDGNNGPTVHSYETIGITSCTSQFDEAFEFAKNILSYDVQITNVSYNPINREAFRDYALDSLDYANNHLEEIYGITNYNDESIIDEYIGYLSSADTCFIGDDYCLLIMNEELPAVYDGQKTVDEVIVIIEDRVNNMIDENG